MDDLKLIKKYYGEAMSHLCRELFPSILESEGLLFKLIDSNFAHSKNLYNDIIENNVEGEFKNYIYSLIDVEKKEIITNKSPKELLSDAGYDLYECNSEEDIQKFKKYYASGEELCTFRGRRLNTCHVFFAVKKDVDSIKRENFKRPDRQDEYGTSVISIQFSRGSVNTLSIKNRYNHTVDNPDATFSNNLENIIEGLTNSFEKYYNLNINQNDNSKFEMRGYVLARDKKYYKYNYEINNIYYGPDNIIIDNFNVIDKYKDKEKYIVLDYFVLDLVNKKIELYDKYIKDSFIDDLNGIKKISIVKEKDSGNKNIVIEKDNCENIIIKLDKLNNIIGYRNNNVEYINDNFMINSKYIKNIQLDNVLEIGNRFLFKVENLQEIKLDRVLSIGNRFLFNAVNLSNISLNSVETIGNSFLFWNAKIKSITLPNLERVENHFLDYCKVKYASFPKLKTTGKSFMDCNKILCSLDMPFLEEVDSGFLNGNNALVNLYLPSLKKIRGSFFCGNISVEKIDLPMLEEIEKDFFPNNENIKYIYLPNLKTVKTNFLKNLRIDKLNLPKLEKAGDDFLSNTIIEYLYLPSLKEVGNFSLMHANTLKKHDFSSLEKVRTGFMEYHTYSEILNFPKLKEVGWNTLSEYKNKIYAPNLNDESKRILSHCEIVTEEPQKSLKKINERK